MAAGAGRIVWPISLHFQDMYNEKSISFSLMHMYLPHTSKIFLI